MLNQSLKNKKVLICITNIEIGGGAEKVAVTLGNEFLKRGIDTTLLTFYTIDNEHAFNGKRISRDEKTPKSVLGKLPRALLRIWKVRQVCKQEKIDVVISFLEESNYYVLLSKLLLFNRIPMIVSVRNDLNNYGRLYRFLIKLLYPVAEKVVAVTKGVEKQLIEESGLQNTTAIYNPIDLEAVREKLAEPLPKEYEWLKQKKPLFITVGRLTKQKGQWHMIKAFSKVVEKNPAATLTIIGEGPLQDQLTFLIKKLGLEQNVFLLGKQKNVFPFLKLSDAFVFTSLWEGMPNVLLEAAAASCRIIAADSSSGVREILGSEIVHEFEVQYPYVATHGFITSPLPTNEEPNFDINITNQESMLANFLLDYQKVRRADLGRDRHFSTENIIKQWKDLVSLTVFDLNRR